MTKLRLDLILPERVAPGRPFHAELAISNPASPPNEVNRPVLLRSVDVRLVGTVFDPHARPFFREERTLLQDVEVEQRVAFPARWRLPPDAPPSCWLGVSRRRRAIHYHLRVAYRLVGRTTQRVVFPLNVQLPPTLDEPQPARLIRERESGFAVEVPTTSMVLGHRLNACVFVPAPHPLTQKTVELALVNKLSNGSRAPVEQRYEVVRTVEAGNWTIVHVGVPIDLPPSFDTGQVKSEWALEVVVLDNRNRRTDMKCSLSIDMRVPRSEGIAAMARFPDRSRTSPIAKLWARVGERHNMTFENQMLGRVHGKTMCVVTREELRPRKFFHDVWLRYPDLELGLHGGEAVRSPGGESFSLTSRARVASRDLSQAKTIFGPLQRLLTNFAVVAVSDQAMHLRREEAGDREESLDWLVATTNHIAEYLEKVRANLPPPQSFERNAHRWAQLADEVDGKFLPGPMRIEARSTERPFSLTALWAPQGELLGFEIVVGLDSPVDRRLQVTKNHGRTPFLTVDGSSPDLSKKTEAALDALAEVPGSSVHVETNHIVLRWPTETKLRSDLVLDSLRYARELHSTFRVRQGAYR